MILSELPPSLRCARWRASTATPALTRGPAPDLVLFHTHRELIGTIRFLALKDPALVTELVSHMLPSRFEPADMLFLEGDFSAEIFFITSGSIVVTLEGEDGGESAIEITAGHAVGHEAALYQHYECTARAAAACEVQGIMRETLRRVRGLPLLTPPPGTLTTSPRSAKSARSEPTSPPCLLTCARSIPTACESCAGCRGQRGCVLPPHPPPVPIRASPVLCSTWCQGNGRGWERGGPMESVYPRGSDRNGP